MAKEIFVLVDKKTGEFWKPKSTGRFSKRRAVNAFTSYKRAAAILKSMDNAGEEVEIKRFTDEIQ